MRFAFRTSVWIHLATLIGFLAAGRPASASLVTYSQLFFLSPVFQFGTSTSAVVSPTFTGGYTFNAEFCVNEFCSTGTGPNTGDSVVRLTNLTLTCTLDASSICGPVDVMFDASVSSAPTGPSNIDVVLGGIGSASGFAQVCVTDSMNLCSSGLQGSESSGFPFFGTIAGSTEFDINSLGSYDLLGDFHINGLTGGSSLNLPGSLDISSGGDIVRRPPPVPEPSTAILLSAGLFAFVILREYQRSRR